MSDEACRPVNADGAACAVALRGVTFAYANAPRTIHGIDLAVERGTCVVLMGASGSGKTTIARLINGLAGDYYRGDREGAVMLDGRDGDDLRAWERSRLVGSVFQDPASQFFSSQLEGEVAFACENLGFEHGEVVARTDEAISTFGLGGQSGVRIDLLSSGQKQKVAIASAVAPAPSILVMDEPSANLDMQAAADLGRTLAHLKKTGYTIVVAEHRIAYLMDVADRFCYVADGRIVRELTCSEVRTLSEEERSAMGIRSSAPVARPALEPPGDASPPAPGLPGADKSRSAPNSRSAAELHPVLSTRSAIGSRPESGIRLAPKAYFAAGSSPSLQPPSAAESRPAPSSPAAFRSPCLEVRDLGLAIKQKPIFDGVSCMLEKGQILAITGDNGAGKTSLAKTIAGLYRESSGTVAFGGVPVPARKRRAFVWYSSNDTSAEFFTATVADEVMLLVNHTEEVAERARRVLAMLGLEECADKHPAALSGGQKQRLSVACGLMSGRSVLILDEPTSGLDAINMEKLAAALRFAAGEGCAIAVITHDNEFMRACCTHGYALG